MAAKSTRQQRYEERKKARGLVKVAVWVPESKINELKALAKQLSSTPAN